ncbi:membrane protein [Aliidongia dinghuensis]|uniref:Membrane protein n=1 Tax=Aliidongia dinghuensis TaxID=1867774 RepID=A0A8J2YY52_9PROT|nr:MFS transporter [Aliidongia dinghuensis]GGF39693.1 membrane protein [Aliidongia dinghuensis]
MATTNYAELAGTAPSEADEKRVFARVAWRILPLLTIAYIVNFLDRTNVGFAALTMNKDVGLSASEFGYGAGILFIGYCFFEVPSNVALYRFGARIWLARIMISWGLISMATVFTSGPSSFYVLRFLLGAAEAGFFPGAAFYLTLWFPKEYRARIYAWFLIAIPASSVIGGPLSGALLQLNGALGLAGWKWLFLAEGVPAVLLGVLLLALLVDGPQKAKFLTPAERDLIQRRLAAEPKERERKFLWESLKDGRVLTLALVQFTYTVGAYGVAIFLPLILKEQHFTNMLIGWLTALANLAACIVMVVWAGFIDRSGRAVFSLAMTCLVSGLGLVVAIAVHSFVPAFIGLTVAVVGTSTARAVLWTIPTRFLTGLAAAGGLAFINSVGVFGGFVGPSIMGLMKDLSGSFNSGLVAMTGFLFVATVLALSARRYIARE